MTEEREPPPEPSDEIAEGFDLPEDDSADTAEEEPTAYEPHVKQAERPQSVVGKLVALIVIPLVAIVGIVAFRAVKRQPFIQYKAECIATAQKFLKGLSDDTAESVPKAYRMLHRDLRDRLATETVVEEYTAAAEGLGRFKRLGSVRWDEGAPQRASRSFRSLAQFDGGGQLPVWFKFARITADDKTEVKISAYKFGVK